MHSLVKWRNVSVSCLLKLECFVLLVTLFVHGLMLKSGFLGSGGGDEKEKEKDTSLADQSRENGNVVYSDNGVDQNTQFDQNTNGSANDVTKRHVLTANDKGPLLFPNERLANLVYGFFLGKRIAYPVVVEYYVKNTCSKYGLVKSMMNSANRENQKWLNKALDEGLYQFQMFVPSDSTVPKLQTAEDLQGDALLHYDTKIKLMNLILLSIPNDIYNSVDACTSTKDMWKRVKRLMTETIQNKVDRETHFTNEFDQFVAELGEALISQFEKLVNTSRAKKLEKSHDPLALVAHTDPLTSAMLLLARAITQNFSNPTNNRLHTSSNTRNQAVIQGDRVNIQSMNSSNAGRNNRSAYVQEEVVEGSNETGNVQRTLRNLSSGNTSTVQCYNCSGKEHYARNYPKPRVRDSKYFMEQMLLAKQDEAGVILTDEQNDFLFADALRMEEIEDLSANIYLMDRIQPTNHSSDDGPSYDSAFVSDVQSSSINENEEQMYPTHTSIINNTIGEDQINSNIIFDTPNGNVNSGSVEKDTHVPDLYALEQLARNAYQEAEK
uniref:Gag-Pol polyprotein n=1 Tax=Tanacetum cinerariifolium TaxID=118510 RepID=A0A6L2MXR9_TANCI|nr:Gag-Pol polyprotein [Tanacetum cinerariifolium]